MVLGKDGKTHYEALGVSQGCTTAEAKAAFRELAKRTHPDSSSQTSSSAFLRISEAIRVLGNPASRASYDQDLARQGLAQTHKWSAESPVDTDDSLPPFEARTTSSSRMPASYYRQQRRTVANEKDRVKRMQARSVKMHSAGRASALFAVPVLLAGAGFVMAVRASFSSVPSSS